MYIVRYTKNFTTGILKDLAVPTHVTYPEQKQADEFARWVEVGQHTELVTNNIYFATDVVVLPLGEYFTVRRNWEGKGYRLYSASTPGDRIVVECGGRAFRTIREAKASCRLIYGAEATYDKD